MHKIISSVHLFDDSAFFFTAHRGRKELQEVEKVFLHVKLQHRDLIMKMFSL